MEGSTLKKSDRNLRLHLAVARNDCIEASVLLSHGANPDAKSKLGHRPLHWAANLGYADAVGLLLKLGANRDFEDPHGRTPLQLAEDNGHTNCVELLKVVANQI